MPLKKLQLKPGLYREGTIYSSSGGWYDGDKIRFRSGLPEKIGGWTPVNISTYTGTARSIWIWSAATVGLNNNYIGLGTNTNYYIYYSVAYYDITPIVKTDTSVTLTTNGTTTVTLTDASYSPNIGDYINFSTSYTVGGYTFLGNYEVLSIPTASTYTIQTTTAPSSASATVTVNYLYPSGTNTFTNGTGWGAGPWGGYYGAGSPNNTGWGQAATLGLISSQLRLWSNDNFGANLFLAPRGGPIYYWQNSLGLNTRAKSLQSLANNATLLTDATTFSASVNGISITTAGTGYTNGTYTSVLLTYVSGATMVTYPTATIVVSGNVVTSITITNGGAGASGTGTVLSATNGSIGGGIVTAFGSITGGSSYTNGTYTNVQLAYVSGPTMTTYPKATIVVSGNSVTSVTLTNGGLGATGTGTVLTAPSASIGGTGSGFQIPTSTITGTGFTSTVTSLLGSTTILITSANAPYVYPYSYISGTGIPANTYVVSIDHVTGVATISNSYTASSSGSYTFSYSGAFIPNETYQVLSSDVQEFVIAFGANPYDPTTGISAFNPLLVRWSDQANPYQWVPQLTNQAGEFALGNGSYIIGARFTRQEILIWTDSAIYSMQYIGAPYVWGFQLLMDNISIISPNAMITVNNITYWMGRDRFYMYNGTVQTLPCTLKQYIFDNLNQSQGFQVFCGANEGFNEVWWFYVSIDGNGGTDSNPNTSVDKYVIYNYLDNVWYYGNMARTAWLQNGINQFPIAADYNNRLLFHENGNDDNSSGTPVPITSYIQSSDIEISPDDAGQHFGFVWRMFPDMNFNGSTSNNPSITMQLIPRNTSGNAYGTAANPSVTSLQNYTNIPEYTIQQFTGEVFTRLRGRQMAFRLQSTGLGVAWQMGTPRYDIRPDGRR